MIEWNDSIFMREEEERKGETKTTQNFLDNCKSLLLEEPLEISVFYKLILIFRKRNGKGRLGVKGERICSWGIKKN